MTVIAGAPASGILDAASQAEVRLIPMDGEDRDNFLEQYPYYVETTIPKDTYTFMTEDVETLSVMTTLICSADLTEDQVYTALTNMFANIDTVTASHGTMATFSMETAVEGLTIPLHPGAEKFYTEHGLL